MTGREVVTRPAILLAFGHLVDASHRLARQEHPLGFRSTKRQAASTRPPSAASIVSRLSLFMNAAPLFEGGILRKRSQ